MKFTDPSNNDAEYEAPSMDAGTDYMQIGVCLLNGETSAGHTTHLLRVELYPLPCDHDLIDKVTDAMNKAAIQVLQEHGLGLTFEAEVGDDDLPPNSHRH